MNDSKPTVYILRGDDQQAIEEKLSGFSKMLGEPDMAEMNTTRLEGARMTLNDLREAAMALPFLTDRRLVIVEDALKPYKGRGKQKERENFLALLDELPQSTALALVIPDIQKYRSGKESWETLNKQHWLIKWASKARKKAYLIDCPLPDEREMDKWVQQKAIELGGKFSPQAAAVLAEYVGNNTQRAYQEIQKLLTYVNAERPVDDDDVHRLTAQDQQGDIFELVDAIGNRKGSKALEVLHILLEESDPLHLYGMIIRQFRLLLQTREILDAGGTPQDVTKILKQHPFVARKINQQAGHFKLPVLEAIHQRLLQIDLAMKTGQMPGDIALDILITELTRPSA